MRVAVVGGGWAGMAAALGAAHAGHDVTVFEAARVRGGRARTVPVDLPDGRQIDLDNGQHILIGAYTDTLRLMRLVGVDPEQALMRRPLALSFPDGTGLVLTDARAPWDAIAGIWRARGWAWRDKVALLRTATLWQWRGFACPPQVTVAELCARLPRRLNDEFIEPLCISALNTPASVASGAVFLRVMKDALFGLRGGSNLLLPRMELGSLFPEPASRWLTRRGHRVLLGQRVLSLRFDAEGEAAEHWRLNGEIFDRVLLATPATEAVRLCVEACADAPETLATALQTWAASAGALRHEAITTVYALAGTALPQPMLALRADANHPAQFVFDRGQLGGPEGLLAFVISASHGERETLQSRVVSQALAQLGLAVQPIQTHTDKRATFACTAALQRPAQRITQGLLACGDYADGPYPATLEGAVRNGWAAGCLP
jgi:squalene-associated FAD-dependent desaturase